MSAKKVAKDHYLFREGDPPDAMYVVKSGRLSVVKTKANSEIVLAEIGPGAMVGEMAFFDNKPRSASVKALKESEVVPLPYKALHAQFANFPEWCKAIMRTVNDHLRNANQRLKQLEKSESEQGEELFPPHQINKLVSILNLVAHKFGKFSEEEKGLVVPGYTLRNFTIQIFQEPTHKMQKMMDVLMELKLMKIEDMGEGRQKIVIFRPEVLFGFVDWHNDWLFKDEKDRVLISESELKIVASLLHFSKKVEKDAKGLIRVNLTEIQNESMRELGYLIKIEDHNSLIEKKVIQEPVMSEDGKTLNISFNADELEKIYPYWGFLYAIKKVRR